MSFSVLKYIPQNLYGFVQEGDRVIFFHLSVFKPGNSQTVPPIAGESVDVIFAPSGKILAVCRSQDPVRSEGIVVSFDQKTGYGFIRTDSGKTFFLHRSEIIGGKLPIPKQKVSFYEGSRNGKPRACYVEIPIP